MQAAKDAQRKIAPSEMFRTQTDKFSQFDENVSQINLHQMTYYECA